MHITLYLKAIDKDFIRVPRANLHLFQSLIYNVLPSEQAAFLHDEDYVVKGKHLKLFAMSWPISEKSPEFEERAIKFSSPVKIVISTPNLEVTGGITSNILSRERLRIGNNAVICSRVEAEQQTVTKNFMTVKTLSPVTCYSKTERNGKPYAQYYDPDSQEFEDLIYKNLLLKFQALTPEKTPPTEKVKVIPIGDLYERLSRFSEKAPFPIIGWYGNFRLEGPKELLQIALDTGIGAKNSGGWGCITKNEELGVRSEE